MPSDATKSLILRDEEVRAVLAGRATVRRAVRSRCDWTIDELDDGRTWPVTRAYVGGDGGCDPLPCPLGAVGERRWVRECFKADGALQSWVRGVDLPEHHFSATVCYRSDRSSSTRSPHMENWRGWLDCPQGDPWRPAAMMPRWASRLTVQIVAARVERGANGWEWVVEIERCA